MIFTPLGLRELTLATVLLGGGGGLCTWLALTASPWFWLPAGPLLVLWIFILSFFRDPPRRIPAAPGLLVSPADGTVTEIARLDRYEGLDGQVLRIGIFLSVFNVHVNRSPCGGHVVKTEYQPGEFLDARHPECGTRNEANTITINPEGEVPGPIIVRQIAGLIARRIVCKLASGDKLGRGQRIGMIKFGSRTELIVPQPDGFQTMVKIGDRVKGGSTVLLRLESVEVIRSQA